MTINLPYANFMMTYQKDNIEVFFINPFFPQSAQNDQTEMQLLSMKTLFGTYLTEINLSDFMNKFLQILPIFHEKMIFWKIFDSNQIYFTKYTDQFQMDSENNFEKMIFWEIFDSNLFYKLSKSLSSNTFQVSRRFRK